MAAVRYRGLDESVVNFHLQVFFNRIATKMVALDPEIYEGATGRICQVFLQKGVAASQDVFLPGRLLLEKISRTEALPVDRIEKIAFKQLFSKQYCTVGGSGGRGSYNVLYQYSQI